MAGHNETLQNLPDYNKRGDGEDVEKILTVVVKRRRTIPTKCMEIHKQTSAFELLRLEKAIVMTEESKEKENFKKIVQGFKRLRSFQFTLSDLHEAEKKLEKYNKRTKEINTYLEKRRKHLVINEN